MFYLLFFFQKAENNRLKKASRPKFCNIIFPFSLKIEWVGPIDQQIYLVSSITIFLFFLMAFKELDFSDEILFSVLQLSFKDELSIIIYRMTMQYLLV